jgi:murein DD-endopeptidase MepM/ murein hydrolase activator NlpD
MIAAHTRTRFRHITVILVLAFALVGCGQVVSGKWYDAQKGKTGKWWIDNPNGTVSLPRGKSGTITVRKGDTYYKLAERHRVSMRALLDANNARPPYNLEPGDQINLPRKAFYTVRANDTLYAISRQFNTNLADLANLNNIQKPYTISVGQNLQVPNGQSVARTTKQISAQAKKIAATSTPSRAGRFLVPVNGRVISEFGPKKGGLHNDGINIAASMGTPIKAAENGVVVYAGNQLRGYGNLLLVRHSGGWVSAYAHTSAFRVKAGDRVKQGQVIAEVGDSGNVDRPQLHFELRKGTRAVNPKSLI